MIEKYCECVAYFNYLVEVLNTLTAEIEIQSEALALATARAAKENDEVERCKLRKKAAIQLVSVSQLDLAHAKQAALCMHYARILTQARPLVGGAT